LSETCSKRDACVELCKKAEQYVSQDHTGRKERLLKRPTLIIKPMPKKSTKSKEELIIELFFLDGKKQYQIADIVYVSRQYVSKVVKKYRAILKENLRNQVDFFRK